MDHRDRRVFLPFVATAILIAAVVHRVLRTGTAAQETVRHPGLACLFIALKLNYPIIQIEANGTQLVLGVVAPCVSLALRRGISILQLDGVDARPLMEM